MHILFAEKRIVSEALAESDTKIPVPPPPPPLPATPLIPLPPPTPRLPSERNPSLGDTPDVASINHSKNVLQKMQHRLRSRIKKKGGEQGGETVKNDDSNVDIKVCTIQGNEIA